MEKNKSKNKLVVIVEARDLSTFFFLKFKRKKEKKTNQK